MLHPKRLVLSHLSSLYPTPSFKEVFPYPIWVYKILATITTYHRHKFESMANNKSYTVSNVIGSYELEYVTCGSVLKLVNTRSNVRLHSHDVKYGSGSGQQV